MTDRRWAMLAVLMLAVSVSACASKTRPGLQPDPVAGVPADAPPRTAPEAYGVRPGSQEDLAANAGDRVFFDFDRSDLSGEARATLDRQAAWLARHPDVRILIAGAADERGTREYNLALGAQRAASTQAYLSRQGVGAGRMSTVSYGKERPLDPGSTEAAWARNRNAQTVVVDLVERGW